MSSGTAETVRDCPCDSCVVYKTLRRCSVCCKYLRAGDELKAAAHDLIFAQKREEEGQRAGHNSMEAKRRLIQWANKNDVNLFERTLRLQIEAATKISGKSHNANVSSTVSVDGDVPKRFEELIQQLDKLSITTNKLATKRQDAEERFVAAIHYFNTMRERSALTDKTTLKRTDEIFQCSENAKRELEASPPPAVSSLPARILKVFAVDQQKKSTEDK